MPLVHDRRSQADDGVDLAVEVVHAIDLRRDLHLLLHMVAQQIILPPMLQARLQRLRQALALRDDGSCELELRLGQECNKLLRLQ